MYTENVLNVFPYLCFRQMVVILGYYILLSYGMACEH